MQSHIEKSLYNGHALFKVSYSVCQFSYFIFYNFVLWFPCIYLLSVTLSLVRVLLFYYVFSLLKQIGYMDIWEAATLSIKKEGYSIKPTNDPVITEKFSSSTNVRVLPYLPLFVRNVILAELYVNIHT